MPIAVILLFATLATEKITLTTGAPTVSDLLVEINRKKARYVLTKKGIAYLGRIIDEASDLVDELDDLELEEAIARLRSSGRDVFRARFLWGWFDGELDDLVLWQEQRGLRPVETLWAFYLTGDVLWNELAREISPT